MDDKDINRLLMHYQQLFKAANREIINPQIEEVSVEDLKPIVELVARSRAVYLKYSHELSKQYFNTEDYPTGDELKKLKTLRIRFEELAESAKAFETSIQRGYLDLKLNKPA